ncbi:hypothetical protein HMPREF9946_02151 [Acetobacteraceae bacterium AT-5844]|nr:hypothetical protein HMPREF9946_02151 [Acetobacteraceae bacterium AT-5844]
MAKPGKTDWKAVEAEFRAGKLSLRQIARRHGISDTAIRKRAKAAGWVRSDGDQKAGANLPAKPPRQAPVARQTIIPPRPPAGGQSSDAPASIDLAKDLAHRLLGELDMATSRQDEIEDAIYEETREDENGRRRAMMLKAVSLPARAMTLKTLAQAMAVLKEAEEGAAQGKKAQRQQSAQASASGRFAPPAPPKLVVNNRE